MNRGQRLVFEITSPNGILLFKEASKAVCIYGMFSIFIVCILYSSKCVILQSIKSESG